MQELGIKSSILREIQDGKKTVEGRLAKGKYLEIRVGDMLQLREDVWQDGKIIATHPSETKIKITDMLRFASFAEMLAAVGFKKAIPSAANEQEALAVYRQFYSEADEREYGVVALRFQLVQKREMPQIIKDAGFDFHWDEQKVWALDAPVEEVPIENLTWHFDVPFLWSKPGGYYDIKPRWVIEQPDKYPDEYKRTMQADTSYPIDIMLWRGRWLILDGLHRLMKEAIQGKKTVCVRKIPESAIPVIRKA